MRRSLLKTLEITLSIKVGFIVLFSAILLIFSADVTFADELSKDAQRQILANQNRVNSQIRAQQVLGYDTIDCEA